MRRLNFTLFVLHSIMIIACSAPSEPQDGSTKHDTADTSIAVNAEEIAPKIVSMPTGYCLDTLDYFDSVMNNQVYITLPRSANRKGDEVVRNRIKSILENFEATIDPWDYGMTNSFDATVQFIGTHGTVISYCYGISFYSGGAAHPMSMYETFNYDTLKRKLITFNDYFAVRSHDDTLTMMNAIRSRLSVTSSFETLYELDFSLKDDSIVFNFDDYEIASYAEGMSQASVARKSIEKLIRPAYQ